VGAAAPSANPLIKLTVGLTLSTIYVRAISFVDISVCDCPAYVSTEMARNANMLYPKLGVTVTVLTPFDSLVYVLI